MTNDRVILALMVLVFGYWLGWQMKPAQPRFAPTSVSYGHIKEDAAGFQKWGMGRVTQEIEP